MLTLLPGDEFTTWNDDIVSWWSLHLSVREKGKWHTLHFGIVLIMFIVWHTQRFETNFGPSKNITLLAYYFMKCLMWLCVYFSSYILKPVH